LKFLQVLQVEKTHDKIDKILNETYADMVMVLINAIYFKGTWTYEFDPEDTRDGTSMPRTAIRPSR
jgi:serine protease inhibitor